MEIHNVKNHQKESIIKNQFIVLLLIAVSLITVGCSQDKKEASVMVGKANPASVYCVVQGGKVIMKQEEQGTVGYCHFNDGKVVEEWTLYRESNK